MTLNPGSMTALVRLARKHKPGTTEDAVRAIVQRGTPFFASLIGETPMNPRTRKEADRMDALAVELGRAGLYG